MLTPYLIRHRLRLSFGSLAWWKSWAKRVRLLPQLFLLEARLGSLRGRGAAIGELTTVSRSDIGGRFANLTIGSNCAVGRVMIQLHDRVEIGSNVVINDGVRLVTGSHNAHSPEWELVTRPIKIDDFAWIATGAMILPGIEVGRGAVVGAGAVVTRSVAPLEIVGGNPAKRIGERRTSEFRYRPSVGVAVFEAWLGRNHS